MMMMTTTTTTKHRCAPGAAGDRKACRSWSSPSHARPRPSGVADGAKERCRAGSSPNEPSCSGAACWSDRRLQQYRSGFPRPSSWCSDLVVSQALVLCVPRRGNKLTGVATIGAFVLGTLVITSQWLTRYFLPKTNNPDIWSHFARKATTKTFFSPPKRIGRILVTLKLWL